MRWIYFFIIFLFPATNCQDQFPEYREVQLVENCTTSLEIVNTFNNVFGTITATGFTISPFTISGGPGSGWSATGPLLPCNLPEELNIDSLKIMFSGYLYEDFPGSNAVGILFEFTRIRVEK